MTNNNVISLEAWKCERAAADRTASLEMTHEFWGSAAEWENLTYSEHIYVAGNIVPTNPWE